jgi:hypothetical protein
MPAGFEKCVSDGGRVRTISGPNKERGLKANEYIRICFLSGKSYAGEVKTKQKEESKK